MELEEGAKYQNMISLVVCTLWKTETNLWYIESNYGKGEPCTSKEMHTFLKSRYKKLVE